MSDWTIVESVLQYYLGYLGLGMVLLTFLYRKAVVTKVTLAVIGVLLLIGYRNRPDLLFSIIVLFLILGGIGLTTLWLNQKIKDMETEAALNQAALQGRYEELHEDVHNRKQAQKNMIMVETERRNLYHLSQAIAEILEFDDFVRVVYESLSTWFNADWIRILIYPEGGLLATLEQSKQSIDDLLLDTATLDNAGTKPMLFDMKSGQPMTGERHPFSDRVIARLSRQDRVVWQEDKPSDSHVPVIPGLSQYAIIPLEFEDHTAATICIANASLKPKVSSDPHEILATLKHQLDMGMGKVLLFLRIQTLSRMDPLTEALKRWYFNLRVSAEASRAKRTGRPISFIMLDIDHFKSYNDTYGHLVGDMVLKETAKFLKSNLRVVDLCCRYGGEEFLIALPATDTRGAVLVAERIRSGMEKQEHTVADEKTRITLSMGIATYPEGGELENVIKLADDSLYRAKQSGRNRVCVYGK